MQTLALQLVIALAVAVGLGALVYGIIRLAVWRANQVLDAVHDRAHPVSRSTQDPNRESGR